MNVPAPAFPPVRELLPHEPPMVLLDDVVAAGPDEVTCAVTIRAGAPFVDERGASSLLSLELMAQAAGVFAGLEARERGGHVHVGFLIGCSELSLSLPRLAIGDHLAVRARRVWGDAALGQFEAAVVLADGGREVARATLNVARSSRLEVPA